MGLTADERQRCAASLFDDLTSSLAYLERRYPHITPADVYALLQAAKEDVMTAWIEADDDPPPLTPRQAERWIGEHGQLGGGHDVPL
jgi:hypothetical protein